MPPSSSLRLGGTISASSLAAQVEISAEDKQRITEDYQRLKTKLKSIEDELIAQLNELKSICLEEAVSRSKNNIHHKINFQQITGQMPKEVYMTLLPGEKLPPVTKRVGTAFKLDDKLIANSNGVSLSQKNNKKNRHQSLFLSSPLLTIKTILKFTETIIIRLLYRLRLRPGCCSEHTKRSKIRG